MTNINGIEYLNAYELGDLVNKKKIKPSEIVKYFEERILERNKSINAIVQLNTNYAYLKAKELEERLDRNEYCGPFAGVPVILKDFLASKKGWYNTHGGVHCLLAFDEYDSEFTKSVEKAGAILMGKANAPAYGFRGTTDNKMFGPTSCPFNIKYNCGGSSGGSAAAVADGLVLIGEGGDAGGSIRLPACVNNLFGFKASFGLISNYCRPDGWTASHPFCTSGGLTKSVKDSAILLDLMKSYNSRDPYSVRCNTNFTKGIEEKLDKNIKIAYTDDFDLFEVDEEVKREVRKHAFKLKELAYNIEEVHFNFKHSLNELAEQWCKGITIDCALDLNHAKKEGKDYLKDCKEDFPEEFIHYKEICDKMSIEDMYEFNLVRSDVLDNFEDVFEKYDLIISPVMCIKGILNANNRNTKGPKEINGKKVESLIGWAETFLVNFIGYPAASVPCKLFDNKLPFGLQIIGKKFDDLNVLKLSKVFEDNYPWKDYYKISFNRKIS